MHRSKVAASITGPNLKWARFGSSNGDELVPDFDQPVEWDDNLASEFDLDGERRKVTSGTAAGAVVTLKLKATSQAQTLTCLDYALGSQERLFRSENSIAALTFCEVPIQPQVSTSCENVAPARPAGVVGDPRRHL